MPALREKPEPNSSHKRNMARYAAYKLAFEQITRAIKEGFPIEAIALEEGIMSDRLESAAEGKGLRLKCSGKQRTANFSNLVKTVESESDFKSLRDALSAKNLSIEDLKAWGKTRNDFVHNVAHGAPGTAPAIDATVFHKEGLTLAKQGLAFARLICAWSKSEIRAASRTLR